VYSGITETHLRRAETMTKEETLRAKMSKINNTLAAHIARSCVPSISSAKSLDLIDRWEEAKDALIAAGEWGRWTADNRFMDNLDAFDKFA
jgi:hypothetical protein|tara:strand:- start:844 stop:1116 length:273 start_codon:yes stop_codon:yes gene_type:complete